MKALGRSYRLTVERGNTMQRWGCSAKEATEVLLVSELAGQPKATWRGSVGERTNGR